MSDQPAEYVPVFGAFNALLGYIGGQAATKAVFERLLWPQRCFSSVDLQTIPRLALLYPMGGPLGTTALEVLDMTYKNGLFKGAVQGHMLGTHFYRDLGWTYTLHALGKDPERESEVRNCIWIQALLNLPLPTVWDEGDVVGSEGDVERGRAGKKGKGKTVRSRVLVNHLTLHKATPEDLADSKIPFISEETNHVEVSSMVVICLAESIGIGIMVCIAVILRSLWCILFIIPLVLRLLSALFAVEREPIQEIPDSTYTEKHRDWEINCPAMEGRFILISGPPTIVNQFFRHYGHPVRDRFREMGQLTLVVLFATYFPVALLCQVAWMPEIIQYIWTVWQVWMVIVMHFDRYTQQGMRGSGTDAKIASTFTKGQQLGEGNRCSEAIILFGQHRRGSAVVKASLSTSVENSYGDGKNTMKSLIHT